MKEPFGGLQIVVGLVALVLFTQYCCCFQNICLHWGLGTGFFRFKELLHFVTVDPYQVVDLLSCDLKHLLFFVFHKTTHVDLSQST